MAKRVAQDLYVAVYTSEDGIDYFAYYGSWGEGKIRWYKTRKMGEKQIAEILNDKYNRNKPPENTRIVKFKIQTD